MATEPDAPLLAPSDAAAFFVPPAAAAAAAGGTVAGAAGSSTAGASSTGMDVDAGLRAWCSSGASFQDMRPFQAALKAAGEWCLWLDCVCVGVGVMFVCVLCLCCVGVGVVLCWRCVVLALVSCCLVLCCDVLALVLFGRIADTCLCCTRMGCLLPTPDCCCCHCRHARMQTDKPLLVAGHHRPAAKVRSPVCVVCASVGPRCDVEGHDQLLCNTWHGDRTANVPPTRV
jgi:hypothetical protein